VEDDDVYDDIIETAETIPPPMPIPEEVIDDTEDAAGNTVTAAEANARNEAIAEIFHAEREETPSPEDAVTAAAPAPQIVANRRNAYEQHVAEPVRLGTYTTEAQTVETGTREDATGTTPAANPQLKLFRVTWDDGLERVYASPQRSLAGFAVTSALPSIDAITNIEMIGDVELIR
jgi:hypothetical protein